MGGESRTLSETVARIIRLHLLPLSLVAGACTREASREQVEASTNDVTRRADERVRVFSRPEVPVEVASGDTFAMELDANVTTGYEWMLADSLPPTVLRLVRQDYIAPSTPSRVGQGGRARLTLRAVGAGTTEVVLVYARPWDRRAVADTAVFRVTVR